jgi:hypothetical protein
MRRRLLCKVKNELNITSDQLEYGDVNTGEIQINSDFNYRRYDSKRKSVGQESVESGRHLSAKAAIAKSCSKREGPTSFVIRKAFPLTGKKSH